ncbi:hypothetical protein Zmor_004154 [Zophobas morio]|uniref:NEDD8-activating enzyme E1 catalytic subunit n=1 Tax=Zophobas morio TaxID=2755281 RepID=A0AA38LZV0_9CUCU|nr:hypothetical protein Zmor_004154 [Zophobas morio]
MPCAGICALEAFKLVTGAYEPLSSQLMFNGTDGIYMHVYRTNRMPDCEVCGNLPVLFECSPDMTLRELRELLATDQRTHVLINNPRGFD